LASLKACACSDKQILVTLFAPEAQGKAEVRSQNPEVRMKSRKPLLFWLLDSEFWLLPNKRFCYEKRSGSKIHSRAARRCVRSHFIDGLRVGGHIKHQ
jgi:hypothetical protein